MAKKRQDPTSIPASGQWRWGVVVNQDPARVYCAAGPNDLEFGLEALIAEGWEREELRPDGPRFLLSGKCEERGLVLVSIDREEFESREAEKQASADRLERRIIRKTGIDDPMRGIRRDRVSFENETSGSYIERGA